MFGKEKLNLWLQNHPEIKTWALGLNLFRYRMASGYHANDGDCFVLSIRYEGREELEAIADRIGIELKKIPPGTPTLSGRWWSDEEIAKQKPKMEVDAHPDLETPGRTTIQGIPAYVEIGFEEVTIKQFGAEGNLYSVTQADFENAKALESIIAGEDLRFKNPPVESENCICPEYYPELWKVER